VKENVMETALGILLFVMIVGSVWCIAQQFRKRRNGTNASGGGGGGGTNGRRTKKF